MVYRCKLIPRVLGCVYQRLTFLNNTRTRSHRCIQVYQMGWDYWHLFGAIILQLAISLMNLAGYLLAHAQGTSEAIRILRDYWRLKYVGIRLIIIQVLI